MPGEQLGEELGVEDQELAAVSLVAELRWTVDRGMVHRPE
jgi:hypothetical protein